MGGEDILEPYCVIKHLRSVLANGAKTKEDSFLLSSYYMGYVKLESHPQGLCPKCQIKDPLTNPTDEDLAYFAKKREEEIKKDKEFFNALANGLEKEEKKEKTLSLSEFTFQDLYNEIEKAKTYLWDGEWGSKERDFPLITAVHNATSHFSYVVEKNMLAHKQKLAVDKDLEFFKKTICNGKEEEEKKA